MYHFQFGQNGERTSVVAKAVFGLSNGHDLVEATDFDRRVLDEINQDKVPEQCVLRSSAEEHWVAHFAAHVVEYAKMLGKAINFHTFVEIPSKQSEKFCGYDLSLGPYDSGFRLRTMHKTTTRGWCDRKWTVTFEKDDIGHLVSLAKKQIHPFFIVVHAFYCIHDWRRLNQEAVPDAENRLDATVTVPPFDSLFRTVIFPLEEVREFICNTEITELQVVRAARKHTGNDDSERLSSLNTAEAYSILINDTILEVDKAPLRPITLSNFLTLVDECWEGPWANSRYC